MATTPTLQDLIAQLPPTLGQAIMSPEEQQAEVQRIADATMPAALRKYGTTAQQIAESNFGRGFGLSSYNAYQQALNTLMQQEGTAQIQNQAQNSVDSAQRSAVANAVNYATSEQNRTAAAQQQQRGINAQKSQQMRQALIGGAANVGAGVGGVLARDLMRPEGQTSSIGRAYDRLRGLFSGGGSNMAPGMGQGATGGAVSDYDMGTAVPTDTTGYQGNLSIPSFDFDAGKTDFGTGSLSDYNFSLPSFQMPDFSLDSLFNGYSPEDFFNPELF